MQGRRLVVALAALAIGLAAPAVASAGCMRWTGAPPPDPGTGNTSLNGVAVLGPCNVYAAGTLHNSSDAALMERFNGSAWHQVTIPTPGTVSALEDNSSAWAVGRWTNGGTQQTLILRRIGSSWAQITSPNPSATVNELQAVAQLGPDNAWAVGDFQGASAYRTLILHWNGTKWRRVPSPNAGDASTHNQLFAIDAVNAHDIWAVGLSDQNPSKTLTLHWNGAKWKIVPSPNSSTDIFGDGLLGVAAVSAHDAWAAGYFSDSALNNVQILHWNGTKWRRASIPNSPLGLADDFLALGAKNVWAVGGSNLKNLVLQWNGKSWKRVPVATGGTGDGLFYAIDGRAGDMWAVGEARDGSGSYFPQAQHCC
jgi:hypothetical protein